MERGGRRVSEAGGGGTRGRRLGWPKCVPVSVSLSTRHGHRLSLTSPPVLLPPSRRSSLRPLSPDTYSLTCLPLYSARPAFPLPSSQSLP